MPKEMFTMQERGVPDPLIEEVVKWCNSLLAEDGKELITELPPGAPDDIISCPCGLVTGWDHYTSFACKWEDEKMIRRSLPESVRDAIRIFDQSEEDDESYDE